MRLLTRSDFDGLVCAVLLNEVETIDSVEFHHPKDMQDGKVTVTSSDIITNLPYHPDAGVWFDHHASEASRNEDMHFKGRFAVAPSAARVVYDYYVLQGKGEKLQKFSELLVEVDKSDSANLSPDDVTNPQGWILLSYLMDPRTGLGKQKDYQVSNRDLMLKLVDWISTKTPAEILEMPDIKERVKRYRDDEAAFKAALQKHSRHDGNVVITDFRNNDAPVGNRFLIYTLFPTTNISLRIIDGRKGEFCSVAVGHSIFNRTSKTDVGALMAKYGGGGHRGAGTCQLPYTDLDKKIADMISAMKKDG
jgi:oligoribonuclease NrnB/cAMP/cGMP phosphodiesterase (DHH superfamily)